MLPYFLFQSTLIFYQASPPSLIYHVSLGNYIQTAQQISFVDLQNHTGDV